MHFVYSSDLVPIIFHFGHCVLMMLPLAIMDCFINCLSYPHTWQLSAKRFVNVRLYKGQHLVDIREYYITDAGERKPDKKGGFTYECVIILSELFLKTCKDSTQSSFSYSHLNIKPYYLDFDSDFKLHRCGVSTLQGCQKQGI